MANLTDFFKKTYKIFVSLINAASQKEARTITLQQTTRKLQNSFSLEDILKSLNHGIADHIQLWKKKKLSVTNQSILWTSRDGLTFESQLI